MSFAAFSQASLNASSAMVAQNGLPFLTFTEDNHEVFTATY
jgi:hypothetical protein